MLELCSSLVVVAYLLVPASTRRLPFCHLHEIFSDFPLAFCHHFLYFEVVVVVVHSTLVLLVVVHLANSPSALVSGFVVSDLFFVHYIVRLLPRVDRVFAFLL